MDLLSIEKDIRKMKYQIQVLGACIDYERNPVESLILSMDWDESQLDRAHDIFEKYDNLISNKQPIVWSRFEHELRDEFGIGYQTVKMIVLAFFNNSQWVDVCHGYAMSFEPTTPIEFHQITRR